MGYTVEINNKTGFQFPKKKIQAIFEKTVESIGDSRFDSRELELSVAFVEQEEIGSLNKQYRKIDSATDVLSFAEYEKIDEMFSEDSILERSGWYIGELIVCPSYVEKSAAEDGESFDFAMTYIISHGILHLLGFSHGEKMFSLQRLVAQELGR